MKHIYPEPLEENVQLELFREYQLTKDLEIRETLIYRNIKLVCYISAKYKADDDAFQIGCIGLIKAVETFNPDKNIKFSTYAAKCITNEIFLHFRANKKDYGRITLYLDNVVSDDNGRQTAIHEIFPSEINIEDDFIEKDLLKNIESLQGELLQECDTNTQKIIPLRQKSYSQKYISQKLGISQSYVSRLEQKFYTKLKKR